MMRATVLMLVTEDWYFVSHRLGLASAAVAAGFRVVVATRVGSHRARIESVGCEVRPLQWQRSGNTPWSHARALAELLAVYREVRPDLVHHVALKPVVFGSLVAWRAGVSRVVNAVAGLGSTFSSRSWRSRLLRPPLTVLLRLALRGDGHRVIVQNREDQAVLLQGGLATASQIRLIRGAGVRPDDYVRAPAAIPPIVVLVARMLWSKGVGDFVAAAEALRSRGIAVRLVLVGGPDADNPDSVPLAQLEQWAESGPVEWWGQRSDVPELLTRASIFCLPTQYGEGIPKSLLEAGAAGLAIVASDSAGCREVIRHNENGLLVRPGDRAGLVAALTSLLDDPEARARLGEAARLTVTREFSEEQVCRETLAVYRELLG